MLLSTSIYLFEVGTAYLHNMAVGTGDVTHPQNESRKKVLGTTLQLFNRQH
jgi:hypothetical protein